MDFDEWRSKLVQASCEAADTTSAPGGLGDDELDASDEEEEGEEEGEEGKGEVKFRQIQVLEFGYAV